MINSVTHHVTLPDEKFSDYEQVYLNMSRAFSHLDKEHWGIHCVCAIQYNVPAGTDITTALRNAWTQLLAEYPGLGMVPVGLWKQYPRLDEASILSLTQKTFFVTSHLGAEEIVSEAKPRSLPSLHYLPASSELVLLMQHWRTDGLGACMLLDRLFELVHDSDNATVFTPIERKLPSMSLELAAGASDANDADVKLYAGDYIENFHRKAVNAGGLPFIGDTRTLPGRTTHCSVEFTADLTKSITLGCKLRQISVSAAVHTALANTVFSYLADDDCEKGYTTVMAVNMRPYLPSPYNSRTHACQTYVASITPTVHYKSNFLESARALTLEYQNWWDMKFMSSLRWIYKYHLEKLSAPRTSTIVPLKPPSGVTLSSLGVVERHIRGQYGTSLKVEKFHFGVSMMTRQMILYAWTFKGRMTLSLSYNEAYYPESMVREVIARVTSHLKVGLEIQSDSE